MFRVFVAVLCLFLAHSAPQVAATPPQNAPVAVTHLGNEGFLIEGGGQVVLVDALVNTDVAAYVDQSDRLRNALLGADPPFDRVDLVLATHVHKDHFNPHAVGQYLISNKGAHFVSTPQAVERLKNRFPHYVDIADRVHEAAPAPGKRELYPRWDLQVLNLHHGPGRTPPIQNHGFLFTVNGVKFFHMGDTEAIAGELSAYGLVDDSVSVAFVPSWYLDADPWVGAVESAIKPNAVVVMHLAPDWHTEDRTHGQRQDRARVRRIRQRYPDAFIFRDELETRTFKK